MSNATFYNIDSQLFVQDHPMVAYQFIAGSQFLVFNLPNGALHAANVSVSIVLAKKAGSAPLCTTARGRVRWNSARTCAGSHTSAGTIASLDVVSVGGSEARRPA
jgi:hypothetical protein